MTGTIKADHLVPGEYPRCLRCKLVVDLTKSGIALISRGKGRNAAQLCGPCLGIVLEKSSAHVIHVHGLPNIVSFVSTERTT